MKTLNSNNSKIDKHIKRFKDPITGKYMGFSGIVNVIGNYIFINTKTGAGYNKVIVNLKRMIDYLASKYKFSGNSIDDNRQNIILHVLEGIPKYDPYKNTRLSTFLQMRTERRLINEIRNENRLCKNATTLNTQSFLITCRCGHEYMIFANNKNSIKYHNCASCGAPAEKQKSLVLGNNELSLDAIMDDYFENEYYNQEDVVDDMNIIYSNNDNIDDNVITISDVQKWLSNEDPRVVKIVELVCFNDYSISSAAKEVGLTGAGASLKLKNLKNKKIVREILGKR